jgi:uncharacterized membrane protein
MHTAVARRQGVARASAEGGAVWHRYLRRWMAWNTLHTILGAAASAPLVASLV